LSGTNNSRAWRRQMKIKIKVSTEVFSAIEEDMKSAHAKVEALEAELLTVSATARDAWERARDGRDGHKALKEAFSQVASFGSVAHMKSVLGSAEADLALADEAFNAASEASLEVDKSLRAARAQRDAVAVFMCNVESATPASDPNVLDDVRTVW